MSETKLPFNYKLGDLNLRVQDYKDEFHDDVFLLLQKSMTDSEGVGEGEFDNTELFEHYLNSSYIKGTVHDTDANDKIISFWMMYPTMLSRSRTPLYLSGYSVVDKAYRGRGIQLLLYKLGDLLLLNIGFPAVLSRMAITARTPVPALKAGTQMIGIIPKSIKVPKFGWVIDLIAWRDISRQMNEEQKQRFVSKVKMVPVLPKYTNIATTLLPAHDYIQQETVDSTGEKLILKGADTDEVLEVEKMIQDCARTGDGFNLDEFCPKDAHFLHKFIHKPRVMVVTDQKGTIKGATIFGFSTLSRVIGSLYTAYFIVKESERRKGIASLLLRVVFDISKKNECNMLLFDAFVNNHAALTWLSKQGFITTGCLPHSGYVAGNGHTDTMLMCKRLDNMTCADLVPKL